jgi:hypothetical protein
MPLVLTIVACLSASPAQCEVWELRTMGRDCSQAVLAWRERHRSLEIAWRRCAPLRVMTLPEWVA